MKMKKLVASMISILVVVSSMSAISTYAENDDDYGVVFSIGEEEVSDDGSYVTVTFFNDKYLTDVFEAEFSAYATVVFDTSNFDFEFEANATWTSDALNPTHLEGALKNTKKLPANIGYLTFSVNDTTVDGIYPIHISIEDVTFAKANDDGSAGEAISYINQTKPTTNTIYLDVENGQIVKVSYQPIEIVTTPTSITTTPTTSPTSTSKTTTPTTSPTSTSKTTTPTISSTSTSKTTTPTTSPTSTSKTTIKNDNNNGKDNSSPNTNDTGIGSILMLIGASITSLMVLRKHK